MSTRSLLASTLVLLAGSAAPSPVHSLQACTPREAAVAGSIRGAVTFQGEVPVAAGLEIKTDPDLVVPAGEQFFTVNTDGILVAPHPYYAVTRSDGSFALDGVPSGTYTLQVWHERLGTLSREVTVPAEAEARVDVEYPAGSGGPDPGPLRSLSVPDSLGDRR